jgi:hypothetical protein
MFTLGNIAFGDNVRIVDAEPTRRSGHANMVGVCLGLTTPSATRVDVVGEAIDDVALNVHFDSDEIPDAWFAPVLVSLVDHAVGSQATVGSHSFVKTADGDWIEERPEEAPAAPRRRWLRRF